MTVQVAESMAPAEWLLAGDESWWDLVRFGPRGFGRYVRVAFDARGSALPPPATLEHEGPALRHALALLAEHTATPGRVFAAVWEGWTQGEPPSAPRLAIPNRAMLLFYGPVSAMRDAPSSAWEQRGLALQEPHLVWPEDRSWLVACEVDEDIEFTVACTPATADALLRAFGSGARVVEYGDEVPLYRA